MNSTDILSAVSLFIALLSLVVTIRSLKLTEQASKAADNSLLLSMYLQKRKDLTDSVTHFYYPMSKCLEMFVYSCKLLDVQSPANMVTQHGYLGESDIVRKWNELKLIASDHRCDPASIEPNFESDIESLKLCVHHIIDQKNKDIAELTKRIEALGGEFLL